MATINGTAGDDVLTGTADTDIINGLAGADQINGGLGNDELNGGDGDDILIDLDGDNIFRGGAGADHITGGAGSDHLYQNISGNPTLLPNDGGVKEAGYIVDLGGGWDTVDFQQTSGFYPFLELHFDHDGVGDGSAFRAGGLPAVELSARQITLAGIVMPKSYYDDEGVVLLVGNSSNQINYFDGRASGNGVLQLGTTASEVLTAITVPTSGPNPAVVSNYINGGMGDDTITGGAANDVLVGGAGADVLWGLAGADLLYGDAGNDTLYGGDGDDSISGGDGNDIIMPGADIGASTHGTLSGGAGDDLYVLETSNPTVVENANEGTDTVISNVAYFLTANVENLTLMGTAGVAYGNDLDNLLIGNASDNNFYGRGGSDRMVGGLGNDVYEVTEQGDTVIELVGQGNDTVFAYLNYWMPDNVETVALTGTAVEAHGNGSDNTLIGTASNNILLGGAGLDAMVGGAGNDSYEVTESGDQVIEGVNAGIDTIFAYVDDYVLPANVEAVVLAGSATVGHGNILNNTLVGNALNNTLYGGGGDDTMLGGAGNDIYELTEAGDTVIENVGEGVDTVFSYVNTTLTANVETLVLVGDAHIGIGNDAANTLIGGAGSDTLNGGLGDDTLIGGAGSDSFWWLAGGGNDVVQDYQVGVDRVVLDSTRMDSFADVQAHWAQVGNDVVIFDGSDTLILAHTLTSQLSAADFVFY